MKPDDRQPALASARPGGLPEPVALVAWNGSGHGSMNLASDSDSFEALLPREPHGVAMGIAAFMAVATPTPNLRSPEAKATPTPTPFGWQTPVPGLTPPNPTPTPLPASFQGCHRWRYALRYEQPSRLAILKNVLGNSVTTFTDYKAPGNGNQSDWPDPIQHSEIANAWNFVSPSQPTVGGPYAQNCNPVSAPVCALPSPSDPEGEQPVGVYYSKGTWDWPKPGPLSVVYDPNHPPLYHPYSDTTGSRFYTDKATPPTSFVAAGYGSLGDFDGWAWTLNYGYAAAPNNDVIYGPDPGPPFKVMNETTAVTGDSIPGVTGTPMSLDSTWKTQGGVAINPEQQDTTEFLDPVKKTVPLVTVFNDPALHPGINQPTWTENIHRDVVGTTKNIVNWGLMTFADVSPFGGAAACVPTNYQLLVRVDCPGAPGPCALDTGNVTAIEGYMRLSYFNSLPNPGLSADGGTPTKGAIDQASIALMGTDKDGTGGTWGADPKKACNRAYGVILCTDGESNTCNTGTSGDGNFWDSDACPTCSKPGDTPCKVDTGGTAFVNFPPGAAETMYLTGRQAGAGDAIVRARTFAIGISPDVSRCELNRIAYRGRTDANAKKRDAGFVLFDCADPLKLRGDVRLPHINPSPELTPPAGDLVPTNESGPGLPGSTVCPDPPPPINRFGPDQPSPDNRDYAFFANDARRLSNAFLAIVRGSASGDYTTSAPVSGAAVGVGSTVVLTSATYPLWQGHIKALDTTNAIAIKELWDAGDVLTNPDPTKPWQPTPAQRQLYTWDPATGTLIEIVAGNAGLLNTLCGMPCTTQPITPAIIDFMRGNDGKLTNTPRNWLLGPSINVTPAIVGPAQTYFQTGNVVDHKPFEALYANRRPLTWLGADDGFLHAFDLGDKNNPGDGTEVIGLLPPNQIANQLTLYNTFIDPDDQVSTDTGQNAGFLFDEHTFGVASSLRFADVWFGPPTNAYKTVGFVTEGPGGDLVAAIDITHPYPGRPLSTPPLPADTNFDPLKPVQVLWTKTSTDYPGLFGSWSVPAVANDTFTTSKLTFGAGINPASLFNAQAPASVFVVDPTSGALLSKTTIGPLSSPNPLVGLQTFTDSIFFQTNAAGFQNDNLANLSLQADENGRVNALFGNWTSPTSKVFIDLNSAAGGPQPLFYSPAANGIGTLGPQVYALASGAFYETSPAVSGWNVNRSGPPPVSTPPSPSDFPSTLPVFVPTLFIATNPLKFTDPAFATVPLGTGAMASHVISEPVAGIPLPTTDPTFIAGVHTSLGIHTQVTSSPLLVGNQASPTWDVFFTVFDPDFGCNGFSYVIKLEFAITPGTAVPTFGPAGSPPGFTASQATTVFAAGAGAASGFVVTDKGAFVGQSGVGKNEASLVKVDIPTPSLPGQPEFRPVWWKEQR